jgi:hypothetical protein
MNTLEMANEKNVAGKSKSAIEKDALMQLIAEEMVTSLMNVGDEDGDEEDDDKIIAQLQAKLKEREKARKLKKKFRRKSTKRPSSSDADLLASPTGTKGSLEDLYYSHVGGDDSPGGAGKPGRPMMPPTPMDLLEPGDDDLVVELKDHEDDSFAAGCLHGLVDDKHRLPSFSDSLLLGSEGGTSDITASESKTGSIRSKDLSMEEIREYVMANIPAAVREQIPEEAWSQIFKPASIASKTPSQSSKVKKEPLAPIAQIEFTDEDDDMDDITVFSDVSGLTGAFPDGKGVETRREILKRNEPSMAKVEEGSQSSQLDQSLKSGSQAPGAPGEMTFSHRDRSTGSAKHPRSGTTRTTASTGSTPGPTPNGPKNLSWDQVEVRYYERILSDNPSVQSGAALGIGWKFKRGGRMDVATWEKARGPQRQSGELVMPRHVRERLLREAGVSQREMADMVRATLKVKNQRKQTVNNLAGAGVEEAVENVRKSFTRILTLRRKKD